MASFIVRARTPVAAPRPLVFQVVAAGGRVLEGHGRAERVVAFTSEAGGRRVDTIERVRLDEPEAISYHWIEGPLPSVEESIVFLERGARGCDLLYHGRIRTPHRGPVGWIERVVIGRAFRRAIDAHLREAKRLAEARAARSHLFR